FSNRGAEPEPHPGPLRIRLKTTYGFRTSHPSAVSPTNPDLQPLCYRFNEFLAIEHCRVLDRCDQSQVFCHLSCLDSVDRCFLQTVSALHPLLVSVQLASLPERPCPCEDRCHRVSGGLLAF